MDSEGNDLPQQLTQSNSTPSVTLTQYGGCSPPGNELGQGADTEHLSSTQALFFHSRIDGIEILVKAMHAVCFSLLGSSLVYGFSRGLTVVPDICDQLNAVTQGLDFVWGSFDSSETDMSTKAVNTLEDHLFTWATLFLETAFDKLLERRPAARASLMALRSARLPLFATCITKMWVLALATSDSVFTTKVVAEILTSLVSTSPTPAAPTTTPVAADEHISKAVSIDDLTRHEEVTVSQTEKRDASLEKLSEDNATLLATVQRLQADADTETRRPASSLDRNPSDTNFSSTETARIDLLTQQLAALRVEVRRPQGNSRPLVRRSIPEVTCTHAEGLPEDYESRWLPQ